MRLILEIRIIYANERVEIFCAVGFYGNYHWSVLLFGIGAIGAALTLGVRGGDVLIALLVLPLYVPTLIFGAGAVQAEVSGLGASAHLSILMAMALIAAVLSPWASAAALRLALES